MIEETYTETNEQYHQGAVLDEYNNEISICSANQADNGKVYLQWAFPQDKDKEPRKKAIPWKVSLGARSQAIKTLEYFLKVLKGSNSETFQQESPAGNAAPAMDEGEIPF